ncbi:hypothetical protein C0416_05465 [bacterium]|nr:hypothetical protein [bacterium]
MNFDIIFSYDVIIISLVWLFVKIVKIRNFDIIRDQTLTIDKMSPRDPDIRGEREKLTPDELFDYVGEMGNDITTLAIQLKALLQEAQEKGIKVDLPRIMEYFQPRNLYSEHLANIQRVLCSIIEDMCEQDGVKMTQEEMKARLEKMGL